MKAKSAVKHSNALYLMVKETWFSSDFPSKPLIDLVWQTQPSKSSTQRPSGEAATVVGLTTWNLANGAAMVTSGELAE